ncbi:MAG: YwaF family protein [Candidatus Caccosoma sp.]|nr:YwaF family protein [Candidatus Caccosoma sp.]
MLFLTKGYGFFDYKDFIRYDGQKYDGQDFFGPMHIIFMIFATILLVVLVVSLKKIEEKKFNRYLKILSIVLIFLEIFKFTWETYYDIKLGHGFSYADVLPLYTCSMFFILLPFAAFTKNERIKSLVFSWMCTIGIFGGLTNFYLPQMLKKYPFFTFNVFYSLSYHFLMSFTGLLILTSKRYILDWKDIVKGWIPLALFCIIVIPVNYYINDIIGTKKVDYMMLMHGFGAPLLPKFAQLLIKNDLQFIFTIFMVFGYMVISTLVVVIYKLVVKIVKNINFNDSQNYAEKFS